jgi:hypothetical protein
VEYLNRNSLDLIDREFVFDPIVEVRRLWSFVHRNLLRLFDHAVVLDT